MNNDNSSAAGQNTPLLNRISVIDSLRGFALAGIVIAHMLENYIAGPVTPDLAEKLTPGIADQAAEAFTQIFIRGKFFALFSFLFGLSFYLQMESGSHRGVNYAGTFLWRILILLAIGYVHSLFYRGDILLLYALLGIPLIPFHRAPGYLILGASVLILLGLGRYLVFYLHGNQTFFVDNDLMDREAAWVTDYLTVLQQGSLWEVLTANSWEGILNKFEFQFGIFNRGYLTFGFFLLGLWAGKLEFFRKFRTYKEVLRYLWIFGVVVFGLSVALVIAVFSKYQSPGEEIAFETWDLMFGLTGVDLINLGMTAILLAVFLIIYKTPRGEKRLNIFIPYGKMALTNYIVQTLIGTGIYYYWGLGMMGQISSSWSFLLALVVITLQIVLSKAWLSRFRYGPLEWAWRSLTHFTWYPLRRAAS